MKVKKKELKPYWPPNFTERDGGLSGPNHKGDIVRITLTPIRVLAMVRAADATDWAYWIEVVDSDGHSHHLRVAAKDLISSSGTVLSKLADHGLVILQKQPLITFILRCQPKCRKLIADSIGWLEGMDAFALPGKVIGMDSDAVILELEENAEMLKAIRSQGSLTDWQESVASKAKGNPLVVFALLMALLGPMLRILRLDGGGIHLWGKSSRGKTTILQVASSVWGDGVDPSCPGSKPFTCRWNLTTNAIEIIGKVNNDLLIALDELGTFVGKDLGQTIYVLAGGQGKAAMNSARKLQKVRTFRGNILSTGEISIDQKVRESGKRVMTGQLLRMIDIPGGEKIILDAHGLSPGDFAVTLKKDCATHFGTAEPEFVTRIIEQLSYDRDDFMENLHTGLEEYATELTPPGLHPEQGRVIRRLAALCVTGDLAVQFGILPFSTEDIVKAVTFVRDLWFEGQNTIADVDRAIRHLRSFILRNHSAFANVNEALARVSNAKGFFSPTRDVYLFTDEQLETASGGHDSRSLARELRQKGFLATEEGNRLKVGVKIAAMKDKKVRFYAVRAALLEANLGDEDSAGENTTKKKVLPLRRAANLDDEF